MANIIMGGIMKRSSQMIKPEAVPFETIQYCRTKHLSDFFSKDGQEDASEFMGIYLDRLIDENPCGLVGRNIGVLLSKNNVWVVSLVFQTNMKLTITSICVFLQLTGKQS
jgi:hypothetical protein